MHTTTQAASLWCPMVRHEGDIGGSFNRGHHNNNPTNADVPNIKPIEEQLAGCHCIADKCAMWRWGMYVHQNYTYAEIREAKTELDAGPRPDVPGSWVFMPMDDEEYARWVEPIEVANARRMGFCGLAPLPIRN